tara:strand:- start:668 stop:2338 length:1671 start_codon:yes stop_codon:yes gene_type:complete
MATKDLASGLAGLGRNGDSTLVHMQPEEVQGLQALAVSKGTSLTINPETGLPEAFSLGGFFKSLLPVAAGALMPASAPLWAGIAAGAAVGAATNEDPLMGAVMGGMGGYSGVGIGDGLRGAAGASAAAPTAGSVAPTAATPGGWDPNYLTGVNDQLNVAGTSMMNNPAVGGINPDLATSLAQSGQNIADPSIIDSMKQSTSQLYNGTKNLISNQPEAWSGFKQGAAGVNSAGVANTPLTNWQAAGKIAMPLGGAALGGLEESDIYGNPMGLEDDPNNKYDPYARLNLSGDTGLRLYAQGGPVAFAAGGSAQGGGLAALKGGGDKAMEGSGKYEVDVNDLKTAPQYSGMQGVGASNALGGMFRNPIINPVAGRQSNMDGIEPPKLGLFASSDRINAARADYENQLQTMQRSSPHPYQAYAGMGGMNQGYRGMGGMNQGYQGMGGALATSGLNKLTAKTEPTGISRLNLNTKYASGGYIDGMGDGMSDSVPATIEGQQEARLADGEFVIPADVVSHLGNGSTKAGSSRLYDMLARVREARTGTPEQGEQINPNRYMPS